MIVVVTGGRTFGEFLDIRGEPLKVFDGIGRVIGVKAAALAMDERRALAFALDFLEPTAVIHGRNPRGADRWAAKWAQVRKVDCVGVPAEWALYGASAGPRRNQEMIDRYAPDAGVVAPGGSGTTDCRKRLISAGVDIYDLALKARN